ncbi:MAG: FAD-dependent oxidoreductase [Candidatus Gastranaerophilales bacterium]|nr:FAD-dependent oxidoreductase [Candidatus Gastranaerophilales bacterium]
MKIVVIGGVAAGSKAAAKSKRLRPDAQVDIYTKDTHVSYSSCGLPYYVQGNFEDYKNLIIRTPERYEKDGINVHLQNEVVKIIPERQQIEVKDLKTEYTYLVEYDKLVIATGATPIIPDIPNVHLKNIFTLRTLEDGISLREKLTQSKKAVIVGGGYIGIEMLEAFTKNDVETTLIEKAPKIMPMLDSELSEIVQDYILTVKPDYTKIINEDAVVGFIGDNEVQAVKTESGQIIETDLVLLSIGIRPVVDIAEEAGIKIGSTGAIRVNSRMETNKKNIYACGDCIEEVYIMTPTPAWIPLGSTANKEGRCAAMNLCGETDDFEGVLGSAVTKYFGLTISMTGFTEKMAQSVGFDTISVMITKRDKAGYMPEAENVTLKLVADKRTHKLLGGQAIGCGDADKRINTLATALLHHMTVEEFTGADITYAPPFSTSIDPLISASRLLIDKMKQQ